MVTAVHVRRKYKNMLRITCESSGRWPHSGTGGTIISGTIIPCCRKTPAFLRGDATFCPSADVCISVFSASVLIPFDHVLLHYHTTVLLTHFARSLLTPRLCCCCPHARIIVFSKLRAICKTATGPCSVEELMRMCDLYREEEEVALELLRDLTQVTPLILPRKTV